MNKMPAPLFGKVLGAGILAIFGGLAILGVDLGEEDNLTVNGIIIAVAGLLVTGFAVWNYTCGEESTEGIARKPESGEKRDLLKMNMKHFQPFALALVLFIFAAAAVFGGIDTLKAAENSNQPDGVRGFAKILFAGSGLLVIAGFLLIWWGVRKFPKA